MLRSAKQRVVVSGLINKQNTKVKEMKTMPEKSKEDEVVYERKRIKSLYGLYNDILKNSFEKENVHVKQYLKHYSKRKLEPLK